MRRANFKQRVEAIVSEIPKGYVMTYGQIAALCGDAKSARVVGGIAHFGDPDLPWQRVVNKRGGFATGYPGGRSAHKAHLEAEGVAIYEQDGEFFVLVKEAVWSPETSLKSSRSTSIR